MTEKEILQAKHRQEEWEVREKVKARKARTRRLIQEGAILEKAFPLASSMELEQLLEFLEETLGSASKIPFSENTEETIVHGGR